MHAARMSERDTPDDEGTVRTGGCMRDMYVSISMDSEDRQSFVSGRPYFYIQMRTHGTLGSCREFSRVNTIRGGGKGIVSKSSTATHRPSRYA